MTYPLHGPDDKGNFGYRDYKIEPCTEPVMSDHYDWQFCHVDYDGAPDAMDNRCGYEDSVALCMVEIDEKEEALEAEELHEELRLRGKQPKKRESI